jgi:hypothetical protein
MSSSIENSCPDFLAFWEEARGKPLAEQKRVWDSLYKSPHRELLELYFSYFGSRAHLFPAIVNASHRPSILERR